MTVDPTPARVAGAMLDCLRQLDTLGAAIAAAHLSLALETLCRDFRVELEEQPQTGRG
jgi:hypothetical protein